MKHLPSNNTPSKVVYKFQNDSWSLHKLFLTDTNMPVLLFTKTTKTTKKYRNDYEITGTAHKYVCGKRFGDFRCDALLFMVIHVIYKYKNR